MELKQLKGTDIDALAARAVRDEDADLFALCNEVMQHRSRVRGGSILAESGVSLKTGEGFVRITWNDEEGQLTPEIAKGLGQSIIDAAYCAEHDAYFVHFMHNRVGLTRDSAAQALGDLRAARARQDAAPKQ